MEGSQSRKRDFPVCHFHLPVVNPNAWVSAPHEVQARPISFEEKPQGSCDFNAAPWRVTLNGRSYCPEETSPSSFSYSPATDHSGNLAPFDMHALEGSRRLDKVQ